ncbi:hypothetical protein MtrunA17_Chr2g0313361 [Medicago truncatula]|uniref:Uncharacterized protein n=1 Tax=Medicago truncatula TaxID=3880 RepID=A0A396JEA4_MEDTR|nr:hypothetical protein MtrunA17_Chr2g0313361 [Medicago truncatula]
MNLSLEQLAKFSIRRLVSCLISLGSSVISDLSRLRISKLFSSATIDMSSNTHPPKSNVWIFVKR